MNSQTFLLEAQYPIWAGAGSLFLEFPALSPVSDEDTVFYVFFESKGLVETKPREAGNGLPDHSSNTELGGE